ncbi:MAG: CoA-binding protein [Sphingobacteriales bacterium]|nr:CoA-binding protein [Sphingobacteriales bacterium]
MKQQPKKTLIIGASDNPARYSYLAINKLLAHGHPVVAVGRKTGEVAGIHIETGSPYVDDIDTIGLYINPEVQVAYYDYILSLHPKRIIFNPGTENPVFQELAARQGIQGLQACMLVLLSTNQY